MNRRNFLRTGAFGMATFTILPRNVLGGTNFVAPSDQINLGLIGCGAQGRGLGPSFARNADVFAVRRTGKDITWRYKTVRCVRS